MKLDEKKCPACAEAIKIDALVCKHCRHSFSPEEVAAATRSAATLKIRKSIDNALKDHVMADTVKELRDEEIQTSEIIKIAAKIKASSVAVEERARKLGMDVFDSLTSEQEEEIDQALLSNQWNDSGTCAELADRHNVRWGQVYDRAQQVGVPFVNSGQKPPGSSQFQEFYRKPLIIAAVLALFAVTISMLSNSSDSETQFVGSSSQSTASNPTTAGMDQASREKYEQLSPAGKEYADEQMKKYDELCASSTDC